MTQISITLPVHTDVSDRIRWQDAANGLGLVSDLLATAGTASLTRLQIRGNGQDSANVAQVWVIDTPDGTLGNDVGPELSAAWETYVSAITLRVAGLTDLVLAGPDNANVGTRDDAEPYGFVPGDDYNNGAITYVYTGNDMPAGLAAWVEDFQAAYSADNTLRATLILDDGLTVPSAVVEARTGGVNVAVTASAPGATAARVEARTGGVAVRVRATATPPPEPLPRISEPLLPNFTYWKVAGGVDHAVRQALNALDLSPVANWYDPDEIPEPVIAAIMDFYGVAGLDTTIFGPAFRRNILAANTALRRFRGTEFVLQEFSRVTGVVYTYAIGRDANTGDADRIVFTVTPPLNLVPFANWQAYMRRAFRWLLPPKLELAAFQITLNLMSEFYQYGAARFHTVMQGI